MGEHEIPDGHGISHDELAAAQMLLQNLRHRRKLLGSERHLTGQALVLRVHSRMSAYAPQRLLELGRREQEPSVELRAVPNIGRDQLLLRIFLGEVQDDRDGFGQNRIAVDEDREPSGGVDLQKFPAAMFPCEQVDSDGLERNPQFLKGPPHADRARDREL